MPDVVTTSPRSGIARARALVVIVLPVLVLAQAALAGQHLFEGTDVITLHGILGNVTFALTVVGVVLVLLVRQGDGAAFALAVALVALTFAQVGLGYVGRETATAAAWHIPLGVAIFGAATYQLGTLRR